MDKKKKKVGGTAVAIIIVAALVLGGFYLMTKQGGLLGGRKSAATASEVKALKIKDLELGYPSTPSEVVKLYWRYTKCIYNSTLKEADLEALLEQLRLLYDEEMLAEEENGWDNMLENIKQDKETFSKQKRVISTYKVDIGSDVNYAKLDGKECATLISTTMETVNSKTTIAYARFLCRKADDGKWKIVGWEQIDANEATSSSDEEASSSSDE